MNHGLRFPDRLADRFADRTVVRRRALVIDPAPVSRELICDVLADMNIDAVQASDGASALAWLDEEPRPDLVVVARSLPSMAGLDIVRHMRRNPRLVGTPAIILVAHGERNRADLKAPQTCLLERPVDAESLRDAVNGWFEETVPTPRVPRRASRPSHASGSVVVASAEGSASR